MKKLCIVFILFVTLFLNLDAQIFYNIEKPLSYQKQGLIDIKELPSIIFDVDNTGNLVKDKISIILKDYLKIEKNGNKIVARVKFIVASKSLGEMTLRFSNVQLNNGTYCYVYTPEYQIVAGPVYQKSINNMLNIVKIPANELVLEIISNSEQDYNLIFSSISFQSIDDSMPKSKYSLQDDETDWDCNNNGIDGNPKYFDNISQTYSENSASYLGAWYDCDLLKLQNLYSINDENIAASRASCIIMEPPHLNTEPPNNWIDYWGANSGTLMNFPESDCKGIIFTAYHLGFIKQICDYTILANNKQISTSQQEVLDNTIIRFNWHHKYGKPIHLEGCSQNDFALWRKTIDFDEVIDYCGVRGVAYVPNIMGFPDYAILEMNQTPFYKELHLGWTTQRIYDFNSSTDLNNPGDFSILGRHGATPTYLFKNSGGFVERMGDWAAGIQLKVIDTNDPALPQLPPPADPRVRSFSGWSGSQLLYPYYNNASERIGLGITKSGTSTDIISYTYAYIFNFRDCYIIDTSLTIAFPNTGNDLYNKYLKLHTNEFIIDDDFYWMPSKENKEKCSSTLGGGTDTCTFDLNAKLDVVYPEDGTMEITIRIGEIDSTAFQGNQNPKGIRIYNTTGDQQTFYFDSFADGIKINSVIKFTISRCDLFYYQMMGLTDLTFGIDYYDSQGRILNAYGCSKTYTFPFPNTLCEAFTVTNERISGPPFDSCCSYRIMINFKGCDDYSNIKRKMLEVLRIKNLNTQVETLITNQMDLNIDFNDSTMSFVINNICSTTSYKLIALFGAPKNCESFEFTLECVAPESSEDCCKLFNLALTSLWYQGIPFNGLLHHERPGMFSLYFSETKNETYPPYCLDYQFISAHVYCIDSLGLPSFFDMIITPDENGKARSVPGTFYNLPSGTYCFYADITTNHGICHDTLCIYWDGTNWVKTSTTPGPIFYIDESNNSNSSDNILPLSNKLDYEKVTIVDMYGKVIIESKPIDKIDVSKLPKGTYNIIYRKKDKIMQTQKLIIK
ncbi:MAG: T9SS type A sorting domain-containing protein [bacterium]